MSTKFPGMEVAIVNPSDPKKKKRKKMATKRDSSGRFKKKTTKTKTRKRRRKSNPAPPARRRRRRRASTPARARRRRRSNPSPMALKSQGMWPIKGTNVTLALPMLGQKLLTALVVKKWGQDGSLISNQASSSAFAGKSWPLRNYLMQAAVTVIGAKLVASRFGREHGQMWYLSGLADMGERLLWAEVFNKFSWGQKLFGQSPTDEMAALRAMAYDPNQANVLGSHAMPGAVYDTPSGRFILGNQGNWQPMQGELVTADPSFDGELVTADPSLDGLGHYLPPGTEDREARFHASGSEDPYASTWMAY